MKALERAVRNLASSEVPVLLLGEPGTGKRALAFQIHQQSLRSDGGFHEAECSDLRAEHLRLGNGSNGGTRSFLNLVRERLSSTKCRS